MNKFEIYFHPETNLTGKPLQGIEAAEAISGFEIKRQTIFQEFGSGLPPARKDLNYFRKVHNETYLDGIIKLSREEPAELNISLECEGLQHFLPGYEYSLGGVCAAIDRMREGTMERAYCYALPSHHAYPDRGHGYCLLNTMAAGVHYAREQSFSRALIIDWDHHHGDGTQTIFERDSSVHQISIHSAIDLYMGMVNAQNLGTTVHAEKTGHRNIPILDIHYDEAFFYDCGLEGKFYRHDSFFDAYMDAINNLSFGPDIIFVFDGHDAHRDDQGKDVAMWDYSDFAKLTRSVLHLSRQHNCPVIFMSGGGYNRKTAIQCTRQNIELLRNYR